MSESHPWYRALIEHLTGSEFGDRNDIKQFSCEPLVVMDEHGEVAFVANVTIEFTPDSRGLGWARILDSFEAPPDLHVESHATSIPTLSKLGARRSGLTLSGQAEDGTHWSWLINGDAEKLFKAKVSQRWTTS